MQNKIPRKSEETTTRDQYTVVLEEIRSSLKGVAEGVTMTNEKMDRGFAEVDKKFEEVNIKMDAGFKDVYKELDGVKKELGGIHKELGGVTSKLDSHIKENQKSFETINNNLKVMRTEISLIRHNQLSKEESEND